MGTYLNKKNSNIFIFLCWLAYMTAYIGRLNYNASMVEIISDLSIDKAQAGLVSSSFFFSYGIGQIINGILSKKYNAKIMITTALVLSAIINLVMPFCADITVMKYLWFLNGAVQSILWCSIIKEQAKLLPQEYLTKAVLIMSTTIAIGTFLVYALSALFTYLGNWRIIFFVASAILFVVALIWFFGMGSIEKSIKEVAQIVSSPPSLEKKGRFTSFITISTVVLCVTAVADGFIKDGITTWVPNILYEDFDVSKSISIILTLLLPLLSIFGAGIAAYLHRKFKNPILVNSIFFGTAGASLILVILILPLKNVPITMLLFMGITCATAGIGNVLTGIIPLSFRDKADPGLVAGILNAFCYFGSTLSITLLGYIADNSSWRNVFVCILIFAAAAFVLGTVLILKQRSKKFER